MGVLQACLSDVVPQLEAAPFRGSDGSAAAHTRCTEWTIVQKAIAGDTEAQERLFARHRPRLYRTAVALLRNKEDAEDAVQDGLCKAYTNLHSFQGRSSFSTWLTSIVINSALMARRRRRAHPEASLDDMLESYSALPSCVAADSQSNPETVCSERQLNELLDKQLLQLRPSLNVAFRLRAIHGFSLRESSQALGISVSAVKARLFWARRMLARGLQRPLRLGQRHGSSRKRGRPKHSS
jgi:RNA polymerase sigma-70 factor (ECF subfamily)